MKRLLLGIAPIVMLACGSNDGDGVATPSGGAGVNQAGQHAGGTSGVTNGGSTNRAGRAGAPAAGSGNHAGGTSIGTGGANFGGTGADGGSTSAGAGGSEAGSSGSGATPVVVSQRRRIVAGSSAITCALDERTSVVCWGSDDGWASHTALDGTFQTMAMGPSATPLGVCAVDTAGMVNCADWVGGAGTNTRLTLIECAPTSPIIDLAIDTESFGVMAYVPVGGSPKTVSLATCAEFSAPAEAAGATRIAIAQGHACTLSETGAATCWKSGANPASEPTLDASFKDLAVGFHAACGLTADGQVRCWDYMGVEDLASNHLAAQANKSGKGVIALESDSMGNWLCVLFSDGRVSCSANFNSQVADFALPDGVAFEEIAVGDVHLCGIRADRSVLCLPLSCADCDADIVPPQGFKTAP